MTRRTSVPGEAAVDLWLLRTPDLDEDALARAWRLLDDTERRRAATFATPRGRARYVAAHLALRRVLAGYTGVPAEALRLGRAGAVGEGSRPRGRPVLCDAPAPVHFSLSHSHGVVAVAVAATEVGADVQRVCSLGTVEACLARLHPRERAELCQVAEADRARAFSRLWSRKEAYLKALGTGLSRGLAADYLGEADTGAHPAGGAYATPRPPGYAAATALRGLTPHTVTVRQLPDVS